MRALPFLAFFLAALAAPLRGQADPPTLVPGSALASLAALPTDYQDSVLQIEGAILPREPTTWQVFARDDGDVSTLKKFTVREGALLASGDALDPGLSFKGDESIDPDIITIDSTQAFDIAKKQSEAKNVPLSKAVCRLTISGGANPVWTIVCFGPDNRKIGELVIDAVTGRQPNGQ